MGVMPWSPLAGGFLAGKYTRGQTGDTGRLSGANPFGDSKFTDRNWEILEALISVAREIDRTSAQTALAWTMARPGVTSTLIGARSLAQLAGNIASCGVALGPEQMARLDAASAPAMGFSATMTQPMIRRMVFGGSDVRGWADQTG